MAGTSPLTHTMGFSVLGSLYTGAKFFPGEGDPWVMGSSVREETACIYGSFPSQQAAY